MRYDVAIEETYTKGPGCGVYVNTRMINSYETLEEVTVFLKESSEKIQKECELLREWTEAEDNSVVHKILFQRHRGVGRLLRKFVVRKAKIPKYNDSLI